jgi:serine phosphatase RsbU (regulator of sigma subunit)
MMARSAGRSGKTQRKAGRAASRGASRAATSGEDDDSAEVEDEGPQVGTLRPEGLSLQIKFAMVISGVSAVLVILMGVIIYLMVSSHFDREVNRRGIDLARQLRARCTEYIADYKLKRAALQDDFQRIKEEFDATPASESAKRTALIARRDEVSERWKNETRPGLRNVMQSYLRNIIYADTAKGERAPHLINAAFQTSSPNISELPISAEPLTEIANQRMLRVVGEVEVLEGLADNQLARIYKLPFMDDPASNALIIVSSEQIEATRSTLLTTILLSTVMAIAIGAGVSLLLASQVTNPVQRLVEDIEIVASGDLQHRTHAVSSDEIGILAKTFDIMTQKISLAHDQEMQHQAREHELNIATEIQSNLLPKKIPSLPGFDLGAFYRPSKEVGGDYYDFIEIDDDNLGVIVADVAGKGIPGSMVMTMARSLIRMESVRNLSPADIFVKTNRVIAQDIKRGMFVTAMYVVINTRTQSLTVASAGHNPMVLYRAAQGKCSLINPKGIALGFDKGQIFERTITEEKVKLEPGDRVVLYTDGVPEAMSPTQEEFSEKRFYKLVQDNGGKNSNQFVNLLVSTLEQWRGGSEQSDDITICTFRLLEN